MGSIVSSERFFKHPQCMPRDDYEHRPFVATNETEQHKVLAALNKASLVGNAIVGVGGFFILNMASISRPRSSRSINVIALVDRSVRVLDFWQSADEIIRTSNCRQNVIVRIKDLLKTKASEHLKDSEHELEPETEANVAAFEWEITLKYSWLSSDTQFQRIKKIFDSRRFFFFQADLFDPNQVSTISGILKMASITVDTVYLSNVSDYTQQGERSSFASAMQELINSETHVVSAHFSTPLEFPMQFLRHKNQIPMMKFLFPEVEDIPEFTPTKAEAAMIKLCKIIRWMDEHRPLVKKVSVVCWAVAAVYVVNRCLTYSRYT
jgi:hypothetical protein